MEVMGDGEREAMMKAMEKKASKLTDEQLVDGIKQFMAIPEVKELTNGLEQAEKEDRREWTERN